MSHYILVSFVCRRWVAILNLSKSPGWKRYLYPVNLVYDIVAKASTNTNVTFNPDDLPSDFDSSVEYVLSLIRSDAAAILRAAYGADGINPVSFKKAGGSLGYSDLKTSALVSGAWEQLGSDELLSMLTMGISGYIRMLKIKAGDELALQEQNQIVAHKEAMAEKLHRVLIEDMNLPMREYNILRYAKFKTASQIVEAGPKKIRKLRNCGQKSFTTIMRTIEGLEVDVSAWEQWVDKKP